MPHAPDHPCAEPNCPALIPSGVSRCPAHSRPRWHHDTSTPRIRGRKLQRLRQQLFDFSPLCVLCSAHTPPRQTISTIRDHIIPLVEGGKDDWSNTQALCQNCSDLKTAQESLRGRSRMAHIPSFFDTLSHTPPLSLHPTSDGRLDLICACGGVYHVGPLTHWTDEGEPGVVAFAHRHRDCAPPGGGLLSGRGRSVETA